MEMQVPHIRQSIPRPATALLNPSFIFAILFYLLPYKEKTFISLVEPS